MNILAFHSKAIYNIAKPLNVRRYCSINSLTDVESNENSPFKTIKRKTKVKVSKDIVQYLKTNNPCFDVNSVPDKYLTRTKNSKTLYLVNPQCAEEVAHILIPHIKSCNANIIECHPGMGILTSHLMKIRKIKLFLHEPDPTFYENLLNELCSSRKVKLFNNDIVQVVNSSASKKLEVTLDYIEKKNWEDQCIYQLIASLNNQEFLRYILRNFADQNGLLSYGRPMMYLFITPSTYQKLIAGPHQPWNLYKPLAVLFQIIFKTELLMEMDRHAFIPWPNISTTAGSTDVKNKKSPTTENPIYLIKVEGKRNVYEKLGKHNVLRVKALQKFVTHVIGRKKQRVIPTIEQWVPGFGPHLIARNINVFTLFNELTPDEIFEIFCMLHHIPGYEDFDIPSTPNTVDETKEKRIDTSIDLDLEDEEEEEDIDDGLERNR